MQFAMLYPEPEKGGRGKRGKNLSETEGFSAARVSQARAVLCYSREPAAYLYFDDRPRTPGPRAGRNAGAAVARKRDARRRGRSRRSARASSQRLAERRRPVMRARAAGRSWHRAVRATNASAGDRDQRRPSMHSSELNLWLRHAGPLRHRSDMSAPAARSGPRRSRDSVAPSRGRCG